MIIWLLRKHPRHPYRYDGVQHLEAFTIAGVYPNHAEAANVAREKNKRSSYLYTVKKLVVKGQTHD